LVKINFSPKCGFWGCFYAGNGIFCPVFSKNKKLPTWYEVGSFLLYKEYVFSLIIANYVFVWILQEKCILPNFKFLA